MQPQIIRQQKSEQILILKLIKITDMSSNIIEPFSIIWELGLFMFIGSSIADTQHIFLFCIDVSF
jgi:hypothetical protein